MIKQNGDWKDEAELTEQGRKERPREKEAAEQQSPEERIVGAINKALVKLGEKIDKEELKVADMVRLLQLRKELTKGKPRYIGIRWVDECDEQTPLSD